MKKTKILITSFLVLAGFALSAQSVKIDYRFNVLKEDSQNYLKWSLDKKTFDDGYDAVSGASLAGSTKALNAVRYDNEKNLQVPYGFRSLLLFPLTDFSAVEKNALSVKSYGKKIEIMYVNNQYSSLITSDEKGFINLETSFKKAEIGVRGKDKKVTFYDKFLKAGADSSDVSALDLSSAEYSGDFASEKAEKIYKGKLSASYQDGVLVLKGNLKAYKNKK